MVKFTTSAVTLAVIAAVAQGRNLRGLNSPYTADQPTIDEKTKPVTNESDYTMMNALANGEPMVGAVSGKHFTRPAVDFGYPRIAPQILSKSALENPGKAKSVTLDKNVQPVPYPDTLSHTLKIGMFIPATNTIMEQEVWSILKRSDDPVINGVGIHTVNMDAPSALINSGDANADFGVSIIEGYKQSYPLMMLAEPEYLMMGMAWDQYEGLQLCPVDCPIGVPDLGGMGMSEWTFAIKGALGSMFPVCEEGEAQEGCRSKGKKLRIGLLIPSDYNIGAANTVKFFENETFFGLKQTVAAVLPFSAESVKDIAHVTPEATKLLVRSFLSENELDVVVQTGTNLAMVDVAAELEQEAGIPILSVNAVLLWHALRENGITTKIPNSGRIFSEF
jgi:maleate isomerase